MILKTLLLFTDYIVDLAITLSHRLWPAMRAQSLDMALPEHVELQRVWRSLVFCRAWLQSTIGACTGDAQLWLPAIVRASSWILSFL